MDRDGRASGSGGGVPDDVHSAVLELADAYWAFHCSTAQLWNVDRGDVDQIEQWEDFSVDAMRSRIETLRRCVRRTDQLVGSTTGRDRTLVMSVEFSATSLISTLPFVRDSALVAGPMDAVTWSTVLVPGYGLTTAAHGRG